MKNKHGICLCYSRYRQPLNGCSRSSIFVCHWLGQYLRCIRHWQSQWHTIRTIWLRPQAVLGVLVFCAVWQADTSAVSQVAMGELKLLGTTYNRAQSADWLSETRFAIGRWDGTISVFRLPRDEDELGPVLVQPLVSPSHKGIELVANVNDELFLTSNDSSSAVVWKRLDATEYRGAAINYDPHYGTTVSATVVPTTDGPMVAVGHAEGFVSVWSVHCDSLQLVRAFPIRSPDPIDGNWQTWHVRGVAPYAKGRIVTVSEDGDICLISIPDGAVLYRQRYHPAAQRGINDVAVRGDFVALVNCSVGANDKNIWVYRLNGDRLTPIASTNLIRDTSRRQVFSFSVELFSFDNELRFLATTEEGLLWLGRIADGTIHVDSELKVAAEGGAVLAVQHQPLTILSAAHRIQTFTLGPKPAERPLKRKVVP